jgi:hypothetical protein
MKVANKHICVHADVVCQQPPKIASRIHIREKKYHQRCPSNSITFRENLNLKNIFFKCIKAL